MKWNFPYTFILKYRSLICNFKFGLQTSMYYLIFLALKLANLSQKCSYLVTDGWKMTNRWLPLVNKLPTISLGNCFFFYFHCLSSSKMITLTSLFNSFSQDITQVALVKSNKQVPVALLKSNFTHLYLVAGLFQLTC